MKEAEGATEGTNLLLVYSQRLRKLSIRLITSWTWVDEAVVVNHDTAHSR